MAIDRDAVFADRDREMLKVLGPHLIRGYCNAVLFSRVLASRGTDCEAGARATALLARLTDRQYEVLGLISFGSTNRQVARALQIRTGTLKKHVENILHRLGVSSRVAAAQIYLLGAPMVPGDVWWNVDGSARRRLAAWDGADP